MCRLRLAGRLSIVETLVGPLGPSAQRSSINRGSVMFLLKKIVSPLFFPLPMSVAVIAAGLALLWFAKKRQKAGKVLVTIGLALLLLFSNGAVSRVLIASLERRHKPILYDGRAPATFSDVKWIVVLGGGHAPAERTPGTSQLSYRALPRVVEAVRLHRLLPHTKLITSGASFGAPKSDAAIMALAAQELGVPAGAIVLEEKSRDTKDQARYIRTMVGADRFILVTAAYHMPRAVALFRKQGLDPIPAPADYRGRASAGPAWWLGYPGEHALFCSRTAIREYLGLAWAKLRGQI